MQELNTMLADLCGEGALESSGVFTLSLEKAGEKLAAFRLVDPGLFVLNLVASAVCARASNFSVETRDNVTTFTFDPAIGFEVAQLERIFAYIMEPTAPPHLREMALALHGARALPEQPAISLSVASTERCYVLEVKGDQVEVVSGSSRVPGVIFRLVYPHRGGWSRLFGSKSSSQGEVLRQLFHFCRFAPMNVSDNGKTQGHRVTAGAYDTSVFAWRRLQGKQPMKAVSAERRFDLLISRKTASPVASSMVIAFSKAPTPGNEGLLLISRGVTFRRPAEVLGFPLAHVVVTADHLEKNLSQSDLVEDQRYENLIAAIKAEIDDLILELCTSPPPGWTPANALSFIRALDQRYSHGRPAPVEVETFRRLKGLEQSIHDYTMLEEQMVFWRGLVHTSSPSADKFSKGLIQVLSGKVTRGLTTASWRDSLSDLLCLNELKGQPADSLILALMFLTGRTEQARTLSTPETPGYSPELSYLLGLSDTLEATNGMGALLAFQRAVTAGQYAQADSLAKTLQASDRGTSLLFLWLGWYEVFRQRYSEAPALWEKALKGIDAGERSGLAGLLWEELSGKVSFVEQVRWKARRGFQEAQNSLFQVETSYRQGSQASRQVIWARDVWSLLLRGETAEAQGIFVEKLLIALINPTALKLEPVNSSDTALSFFV